MISNAGKFRSFTSISTVRSSSLPSRSCARSFSRVRFHCRARLRRPRRRRRRPWRGGSSRSRIRSSAFARLCPRLLRAFRSRTMSMAISTRSRIIDSTSRPTYPTSVNLEASTFRNGELASFASRRAISVLPTPVGPDHDDVLRHHFFGHFGRKLLAADAVSKRDRDGALGAVPGR